MKYLVIAAAVALLSGCAARGLYNWGGYDDALYASYKDPTKAEALRTKLETHIAAMESAGQKVAPGLYAELGTLYFQAGAKSRAAEFYAKEQKAWPESSQLMTALINNIQRTAATEAEKK
ncbi:DUF4810 domain-containing protein [Ramlibacter alkalitolerans]|uniref:DUF4810 domain-containing protein n=1 Tax=Ramlibacter alkalitolerans TaxID=2039631 RepID=A0ABS1JLG1_9BURK|nr:DUF4810 domain-containing protein [Ramlibacter alkalitolerans]MBL0424650.1 DUF4810 domain-containing protein [Ramlibacter alkalitolerans]